MSWKQEPSSDGQIGLLWQLRDERVLSAQVDYRLTQRLNDRANFTKGEAHTAIDYIISTCPKRGAAPDEVALELAANGVPAISGGSTDAPKVTTPGMFRLEGNVYVVVKGRNSGKHYAKRLVELRNTQGDRLTDADGHVRFDFEYERGAIFRLDESMRLSQSEGKELAVRYGKCAMCGRKLKVAESVERGYGPVCWSRFTPEQQHHH